MKRILLAGSLAAVAAQAWAGFYAPGIVIDSTATPARVDDWDGQVPVTATDPSGDAGTGRDLSGLSIANDSTYLYIRISSSNTKVFSGNDFIIIDGDNSAATGFNTFSWGNGTDTRIGGNTPVGSTTAVSNNGAASPTPLTYGPSNATTVATGEVEYRIALNTTIPGNITQSFPGGLGSTIKIMYRDNTAGAGDQSSVITYTLATATSLSPNPTVDDMSLYDSDANAAVRSFITTNTGGAGTAANYAAGGPAGAADTALKLTEQNATGAFTKTVACHRFAQPRSIINSTSITLDFHGAAGLIDASHARNVWLGLKDLDGTYYAKGLTVTDPSFPSGSDTGWVTLDFGPASGFTQQTAGTVAGFDLANLAYYEVGIQDATAGTSGDPGRAGGTGFAVAFDNLKALGAAVPVTMSAFELE